jgi:hypothetical protein
MSFVTSGASGLQSFDQLFGVRVTSNPGRHCVVSHQR